MVEAKRARRAETPKQPSFHLRLRASYFYPTPSKLREVPAVQKRQVAKPLAYYANKYSPRNAAIEKAYLSGGYSMKEIGDYFGLHYSRISRIMKELEKAKGMTLVSLTLGSLEKGKRKGADSFIGYN